MSFDIYGNNLRSGHCEVHPHVHESYPCSVCYGESTSKKSANSRQKEVDKHYSDMQNAHERAYYEDLAIGYSFKYKMIARMYVLITSFQVKFKEYKEVQFTKTMTKHYK